MTGDPINSSDNPDPSSTYWQWAGQYGNDMTQLLKDVSTMKSMIASGAPPQDIIIFVMMHVFPDKTQLGQDNMKEQAYSIDDLAGFTNDIAKLQADLQSGNYSAYQSDYATLSGAMASDPWLQDHSATFSGGDKTFNFTFTGILGSPSDSSSNYSALQTELADLGKLANNPSSFYEAYYNLTGQTPPASGGFVPPSGASGVADPSKEQGYVNDFAQATSQVSSASSMANNMLQYQQQDYQKVTQSIQDILNDSLKLIQQINSNTKSQ